MLKIKLIKSDNESDLENKINDFIGTLAGIVVEVNIQRAAPYGYLASILYRETKFTDKPIPGCHNIPEVETVLLGNRVPSSLPFDKLANGDSLGSKD